MFFSLAPSKSYWSDVYVQGICNAPGTAKAIAELVMEGKVSCANLQKLDPARFS